MIYLWLIFVFEVNIIFLNLNFFSQKLFKINRKNNYFKLYISVIIEVMNVITLIIINVN